MNFFIAAESGAESKEALLGRLRSTECAPTARLRRSKLAEFLNDWFRLDVAVRKLVTHVLLCPLSPGFDVCSRQARYVLVQTSRHPLLLQTLNTVIVLTFWPVFALKRSVICTRHLAPQTTLQAPPCRRLSLCLVYLISGAQPRFPSNAACS